MNLKGKKIVLSFIVAASSPVCEVNYVHLEIHGKKFQIWVHK